MSLDKAIEHGKEKRKAYRGAKAVDTQCRNHGSCHHCGKARKYKAKKREKADIADYVSPEDTIYALENTKYYLGFSSINKCLNSAIDALEKQIGISPKQHDDPDFVYGYGFCPVCGKGVARFIHDFCNRCGQKLDWSDIE